MTVKLRHFDKGDMGLSGVDNDDGGFIPARSGWVAATVDHSVVTVARAMRVKAIIGRVDVAGTDGGAVTLTVRKVPSATALASGTALHASTFNLKGTLDTNQTLTLSTTSSDLDLAAGDSIVFDFTGTLTSAVGSCTVWLSPK